MLTLHQGWLGVRQLTVFLNQELARKIEYGVVRGNRDLVEAWNSSGFSTTVMTKEFNHALAIYGGAECPVNETVGLGMFSPVAESTIEEIERFYHANHHASVIRVCPLAHPSLIEFTRQRGYVLNGFSYRWILDLNSWEPRCEVADSRVQMATKEEEMEWARVVAAGFADVDAVPVDQNLDLDRAFFRMQNSIPVLAFENGVAAAGGIVALGDEVAALFATSTRRSYRKRGLQTALLDWRLRFAKENGATIATIETEPGSNSQRNAERMGFRLAYVTAELVRPAQS